MKRSTWLKWGVGVLSVVTLFSSCLKNNDDYKPGVSSVSLINAYSGEPSVDFYMDNIQVNTQPILYKQNTAYLGIYSGNRYLGITEVGSRKALINGLAGLAPGKVYSFFIAKKGTTTGDSITGIVVEDDLKAPASGMAKVRFANFSPGSTQIDVYEQSATDSLFGKKSFRTVSPFKEIAAGDKVFELRQTGQTEVKLSVPVTVEAGKIYTLTATGLWEGTPGTIDVFGAITTNHSTAATNAIQ